MGKFNLLFQKARDSLSAAQLLLEEGYIDITASRVYYAMFYIAEALLFSKGLAFTSHSAVIAAYGKEFARTGLLNPEHHQHLRDAFQARQVGDYLVEREISSATVVELIEWGKGFLLEAENYLKQSGQLEEES
jgi:uncharacterized protein (UPF0332 family)